MAFFLVTSSERPHEGGPTAFYAVAGKRGYDTREGALEAAALFRSRARDDADDGAGDGATSLQSGGAGGRVYVVEAENSREALAAFRRGEFLSDSQ